LFEEALELDPDARERLLVRAAETDAAIAHEVRSLLETHVRAGGFLETPAWAADPELLTEALDAPHYEVGRQLGPYRLKEEIGRGGMGIVYAAEDARLGRTVALKALPPSYTREPSARERLTREARAAAALTHPAIATIYALEEIDGDLFIASELIRGDTLRSELANGPLPQARLEPTLLEIAAALDAAHREGIVHRDLKPENVMRTADGHVKIVDFGLARATAPATSAAATLTRTGSLLGTPGYMAPEQLRGETLDARADVFAFGVMACELATGAHPFGGNDPAALVERMLSDAPLVPAHLSTSGLDAVVRRCLQGARESRYANGIELHDALRAAVDAGPAPPTRPAKPKLWWWQFHQIAVALLCGAALIPTWLGRSWIGAWGSAAFLGALVPVTITIALRLHLWFVSHVDPASFPAQRARLLPWIVAIETLLVVLLTAVAIAISGRHDPAAAWLVVTALLLLVSIVVIEPATTRAALE
jgi:hypothetical protein